MKKGRSQNLLCEIEGHPTPRISWTKLLDDQWVGPSDNVTYVSVTNPGMYKCTVENIHGTNFRIFVVYFLEANAKATLSTYVIPAIMAISILFIAGLMLFFKYRGLQ